MKQRIRFAQYVTEGAELPGESVSGQPIVELTGDSRVLIENHSGVSEYTRERIGVRLCYGMLCVCGEKLELLKMTNHQLVIRGRIDNLSVFRGKNP